MIRNWPDKRRIETHAWLSPPPPLSRGLIRGAPRTVPAQSQRTVRARWHRGSLEDSLEAIDDATADGVLDDYIAKHLPPIELDSEAGVVAPFWLELALANGTPRSSVWKRNPPARAKIERCIEIAMEADVVSLLPFWRSAGRQSQTPLVYFRDSGLLRRLLDRSEGAPSPSPDPTEETRRVAATIRNLREKRNDLSWEGFIIDALRVVSAERAAAFVWRQDDDEIDLVLKWGNGERWGIEVTRGKGSKKPHDGFFAGCKELGIAERFVVAPTGIPHARKGVECLDLATAIARVFAG
jgi:uncharacterized protein DUF4143